MRKVYFTRDDMCTTLKLEVKRIYDYFLANDWFVTDDPNTADLVLCLTCSGWKKLEQASLQRLRSLQPLGDKVICVGCTNDNNPTGVAEVHKGRCFPTRKLHEIDSLIPNPRVKLSEIPQPSTFKSREDYRLYDITKRFVNIAFGCSFSCSYCPHTVGLGPLKSRTVENILSEIENLIAGGVRIVVLTGMETAMYGRDIGTTFPYLLNRVLKMNADFDINIGQFHPIGILKYYDELLPLFSSKRITDIQIPIQTTSDRILKMMKRPLGIEKIAKFLREVKSRNRSVILRTDLIVGFPTETMEELDGSLRFVADVFDEIAIYGVEIREYLHAGKYLGDAFSMEEINRRIEYATRYIESNGKMSHGGQQSEVSLDEVEKRKEEMRRAKKALFC
jgi:tRNA A37 methylthiotransferase MiaB